jgi:hypothetical protein
VRRLAARPKQLLLLGLLLLAGEVMGLAAQRDGDLAEFLVIVILQGAVRSGLLRHSSSRVA